MIKQVVCFFSFSNLIILFLKDFYLECLRSRQNISQQELLCNTYRYWYIYSIRILISYAFRAQPFHYKLPFPHNRALLAADAFFYIPISLPSRLQSRDIKGLQNAQLPLFFFFIFFFSFQTSSKSLPWFSVSENCSHFLYKI